MGNCSHDKRHGNLRRVKLATGIVLLYMLVEVLGGYLSNSLALFADATHMFTDFIALSLTLAAFWFALKPANPEKTYGYHRLEILAAFVNGVFLFSLSVILIYQAYVRFWREVDIKADALTIVAFGGLVANFVCAYLLSSGRKENLNLRSAWLHIVADALGSLAAVLAGILILAFGWTWSDSLVSFLISLIIIYSAWNLIKDSVNVLLEGTPSHINLKAIEKAILETGNIKDVHDLHVWTITSGIHALSVHVVHEEGASQKEILRKIRSKMNERFGIGHLTVQMETENDNSCSCAFKDGNQNREIARCE